MDNTQIPPEPSPELVKQWNDEAKNTFPDSDESVGALRTGYIIGKRHVWQASQQTAVQQDKDRRDALETILDLRDQWQRYPYEDGEYVAFENYKGVKPLLSKLFQQEEKPLPSINSKLSPECRDKKRDKDGPCKYPIGSCEHCKNIY
jgi:hypothetical protein